MKINIDVVIRADGSKKIGMGHIMPMITLGKELIHEGLSVSFVSFDDPRTVDILKANNFDVELISDPKAFDEIQQHITRLSPKLVVQNTFHNEDTEHFAALKSAGSCILGFYQIGLGLQRCDAVINPLPSVFIDDRKSVTADYYEGPGYLLFNDEARRIASKVKIVSPEITDVVISIGGTDVYNLTPKVSEIITRLMPEVRINPILGRIDQIMLFNIIQKSGFLVTSGGTTLFESAFLGTPSIAIAQEEWEIKTAKYVENEGATKYAGLREKSLANLGNIVQQLSLNTRCEMRDKGKKLVDGKGLERVMAIIKNLL